MIAPSSQSPWQLSRQTDHGLPPGLKGYGAATFDVAFPLIYASNSAAARSDSPCGMKMRIPSRSSITYASSG